MVWPFSFYSLKKGFNFKKVLGQKFWKFLKKCEEVPKRFCPLVVLWISCYRTPGPWNWFLSPGKPNASSISTPFWKVFEGFLKAFWRVLQKKKNLQRPLQKPFRDPFRDPSGVRGFCSRSESLDFREKKQAHTMVHEMLSKICKGISHVVVIVTWQQK